MGYKVFISYATKDLAIVNHIQRLLTDVSIEVFVAEYSVLPGTLLPDQIKSNLKTCDLFILLWSQNSKLSEWVPQEIGIAVDAEKVIMPIVLEPNLQLPGFIKNLKYLPVYNNPNALNWVRSNVFERAREKQRKDGLTWLGIGAVVLWLMNRED